MTTTACTSTTARPSTAHESEVGVARAVFGHAQLGDVRRTNCLVNTFEQMRKHPGGTLPDKLAVPPDLRAFYRLCDAEKVTHAALIEAARFYTLRRIANHDGPVLVLHDATELDYTSLKSLSGDLGQIGTGSRRGYVSQNVLAVAADSGEVPGLLELTAD